MWKTYIDFPGMEKWGIQTKGRRPYIAIWCTIRRQQLAIEQWYSHNRWVNDWGDDDDRCTLCFYLYMYVQLCPYQRHWYNQSNAVGIKTQTHKHTHRLIHWLMAIAIIDVGWHEYELKLLCHHAAVWLTDLISTSNP